MKRPNQASLFGPLLSIDEAAPGKKKEEVAHGLLNPILVRLEQDGTFTTLAGSRRLKACRQLGNKTIPDLVIDDDPLPLLAKEI